MRPPIYLADDEARCRSRAMKCSREGSCARALAALPAKNATVADLSLGVVTLPLAVDWCVAYIDVADAVKPVADVVVKPAIGGRP